MLRLFMDEDRLDRRLAAALRRAGFDVLTVAEAGRAGGMDREHLDFASAEGRVVYSANVGDFAELDAEYAAAGVFHAGIIVTTNQRLGIGEQVRQIEAVARRYSQEEMRGRLEWIGRVRDEPPL